MGILSFFFGCKERVFESQSNDFKKIESKLKISICEADEIYENNFKKLFNLKRDKNFNDFYFKIKFVEKGKYYIGYQSLTDKKDYENGNSHYFAVINPIDKSIEIYKK